MREIDSDRDAKRRDRCYRRANNAGPVCVLFATYFEEKKIAYGLVPVCTVTRAEVGDY